MSNPRLPDDAIRPTRVEVNLAQIARNYQSLAALAPGARVMAVVKANAYGHGMVATALELQRIGAHCLGVALLEEAEELRRAGVMLPILVFGGISEVQIPRFLQNDLTLTAPSIEKLDLIDRAAASLGVRARVHLKVDTGMERLGMHHDTAPRLLEASLKATHVQIEGIYSHLACADEEDLSYTHLQLQRFAEVCAFYTRRGLPMPTRHIANSAALLRLPQSHLDMVRPGIALYGCEPGPACPLPAALRPALCWKSHVAYFKVVRANSPVSYGGTWSRGHDVRMVTVPVGYGDGYFRSLSNVGEVLIGGQRHGIAGRVCMDQVMIDLERGSAYYRDEVVLLGSQGDQEIRAEEVASRAGSIAYEVLTNINSRVPRVHHHDGVPAQSV